MNIEISWFSWEILPLTVLSVALHMLYESAGVSPKIQFSLTTFTSCEYVHTTCCLSPDLGLPMSCSGTCCTEAQWNGGPDSPSGLWRHHQLESLSCKVWSARPNLQTTLYFLCDVGMGLCKNSFLGCILIITGPASEFWSTCFKRSPRLHDWVSGKHHYICDMCVRVPKVFICNFKL
jgi:hypothetical protein